MPPSGRVRPAGDQLGWHRSPICLCNSEAHVEKSAKYALIRSQPPKRASGLIAVLKPRRITRCKRYGRNMAYNLRKHRFQKLSWQQSVRSQPNAATHTHTHQHTLHTCIWGSNGCHYTAVGEAMHNEKSFLFYRFFFILDFWSRVVD